MLNDLDKLFAAIDQAFEAVRQAHPEEIACGKGCADCCQAVFDVSLVEAVNLQAHLQRLDPTAREEIARAAQRPGKPGNRSWLRPLIRPWPESDVRFLMTMAFAAAMGHAR